MVKYMHEIKKVHHRSGGSVTMQERKYYMT